MAKDIFPGFVFRAKLASGRTAHVDRGTWQWRYVWGWHLVLVHDDSVKQSRGNKMVAISWL